MKWSKSIGILLVISCWAAILTNCSLQKQKEEEKEDKIVRDIDKLVEDLPNPSKIPFSLKNIGIPFVDSLINTPNIEKYQNNTDDLALNMGIYAADACYAACYLDELHVMEYVHLCHKIATILGDSAIFKDDIILDIKNSINDNDKLSTQLRKMIVQTSVQLEKDHHLTMAALALAGIWVEEMYLAVKVVDQYDYNDENSQDTKSKMFPLVQLILSQQKPLYDLIALFDDIPHDDKIRELIAKFKILKKIYDYDLQKIKKLMDKNPNFIPDRDSIKPIYLEIVDIRQSIVK